MIGVTQNVRAETSRRSFTHSYELLQWHFAGYRTDEIITTSRTFPAHMRADLHLAVRDLLAGRSQRFVGIAAQNHYEPLTFTALLETGNRAKAIAPVTYEEVDTGEDAPISCPANGLWLVEEDSLRIAILVARNYNFRADFWKDHDATAPYDFRDAASRHGLRVNGRGVCYYLYGLDSARTSQRRSCADRRKCFAGCSREGEQISAARKWALNLIDANAGGVKFSSEACAQLLREPLKYAGTGYCGAPRQIYPPRDAPFPNRRSSHQSNSNRDPTVPPVAAHVPQHLRPSLPGDDFWRKPWVPRSAAWSMAVRP